MLWQFLDYQSEDFLVMRRVLFGWVFLGLVLFCFFNS